MARSRFLTEYQRGQIEALQQEGLSPRAIAYHIGKHCGYIKGYIVDKEIIESIQKMLETPRFLAQFVELLIKKEQKGKYLHSNSCISSFYYFQSV